MKKQLMHRLTQYVQIDTQSDATSITCPTTSGQWDLLHILKKEMMELGLQDVTLSDTGYLFGTIPATTKHPLPTIGFLAHVDTAPDYTGKNVVPQIVHHYDGQPIPLTTHAVLAPQQFPSLTQYIGHTLMTTDGQTLLGADNKAGIAEILTAADYLLKHPELEHGPIRIGFTPDEEIGRGPERFDVEAFGADFAFTMDGGPLGELQYESFHAASLTITCVGVNIHPGSAKGKMINSLQVAHTFHEALPKNEVPEKTDGLEGFIHLLELAGTVEKTTASYIIRYFDRKQFEERKQFVQTIADQLNQQYNQTVITIQLADQYYNMREKIEPVFHIVETVAETMESLNIPVKIEPIRGGTDGSQLSYMGLPTPNIFTGGENYHGKYEFISIDVMEKATQVIIDVVQRFAKKERHPTS